MSDDLTKNIEEKYQTKPTIETILERINALDERLGVRLDRIESEVKLTHSELYALRADFTELKGAIKEHFALVKS
jgi:hypothetical protein